MREVKIPKIRAQFKQQRIDDFRSLVSTFKKDKGIDFFDALNLASKLQKIWHDFVSKINDKPAGHESAQLILAEIFFTLKEYFICLGDLIDCIETQENSKLDSDSRFILAICVEFILAQSYAEFSKKAQPAVEILAAIGGDKRCAVDIGIDGQRVDLFDELIKQTKYITGRAMSLAKEKNPVANLMTQICILGTVLGARFRVIQARVNSDKSVVFSNIINPIVRCLFSDNFLMLRGLGSVEDEFSNVLTHQWARLYIEGLSREQKIGSKTDEERIEILDQRMKDKTSLNSLELQAFRLSVVIKNLHQKIQEKILSAKNDHECQRIKQALNFLKLSAGQYFSDIEDLVGDSDKEGAFEQQLSARVAELVRNAEKEANEMMEQISDEQKEREKAKREARLERRQLLLARQKKREKVEGPTVQEIEKFEEEVAAESIYTPSEAETFYQALAKSQQSDQEKLKSIDDFCRSHCAELEADLRAKIFLEISRAELLIKLNANKDYISSQRDLLLALQTQESVYGSWLQDIIERLNRYLLPPEPKSPEPSIVKKSVPPEQQERLEIPSEIRALLMALGQPSCLGFVGQAYVVGGYVRDALLKIQANDIDLVCIGYSVALQRNPQFHKELKIKLLEILDWDPKDESQIVIRNSELDNLLIISLEGVEYEIWFSEEPTLGLDAKKRDLTFNSLFARADGSVFSPFPDAIVHARKKLCAPANPKEFFDDPVRLLRLLDYVLVRGYAFDDKDFKNSFYAKLKELKKLSKLDLEKYLGDHQGHFAARIKKLFFSAQDEKQRAMLCALLSPAFFSWLSPEACQLLAKKSLAYAKIISEKSQQYGFSLAQLGVFGYSVAPAVAAAAVLSH